MTKRARAAQLSQVGVLANNHKGHGILSHDHTRLSPSRLHAKHHQAFPARPGERFCEF
jgi:hypothetical protein